MALVVSCAELEYTLQNDITYEDHYKDAWRLPRGRYSTTVRAWSDGAGGGQKRRASFESAGIRVEQLTK
ncbi:hypothetical protein [Bradyrhizobium sp. ORS 86]|uniref:hypothetical protein n=1 Tax=Bradyrhizobium sp. ORS 86 TaxID=1685970 RepID=UPI00388F6D08